VGDKARCHDIVQLVERRPSRSFVVVRTAKTAEADWAVRFAFQGFDESTAAGTRLQPGDRLAIYVARPVSGFVATVEVVSDSFRSSERIWTLPEAPAEVFPIRYRTRPRVIVGNAGAVPFIDLIDELDYSRHLRNRDRWGMLFIRAIRSLTDRDFDLIENRLRGQRAGIEFEAIKS
jgi:predicted RNA-binding protein